MYDKIALKEFVDNSFHIVRFLYEIVATPKYKQKPYTYFTLRLMISDELYDVRYYPFAKNFKVLISLCSSHDFSIDSVYKIFNNFVDNRIEPIKFYKYFGTSFLFNVESFFNVNRDVFPGPLGNFSYWLSFHHFKEDIVSTIKDLHKEVL